MARRLLLEGGDLAELLARVGDELGPGAQVVRAERVRSGGLGGFFQREHFELTVEVPDVPSPRPYARRVPPVAPRAALEDLLDSADAADEAAGRTATVVSTGGAAFSDVLEQVRAVAAERGAATAAPGAGPRERREGGPGPAVPEVLEPPSRTRELPDRLAALGVPAALLARRPRTLAELVLGLPPAPEPPRAADAVLVVVGPAGAVDLTAALLADRLGLAPDAVVPAGTPTARAGARSRPARTRPGDEEQARAWRSTARTHASVVALAVGDGPRERAEAGAILRALRPDQAWALVDARTKTADVAAWLADVGSFDALAVRGLYDTSEPGAVLGLGLPVAWFDGIPATPAAWAAALDTALGGRTAWDD